MTFPVRFAFSTCGITPGVDGLAPDIIYLVIYLASSLPIYLCLSACLPVSLDVCQGCMCMKSGFGTASLREEKTRKSNEFLPLLKSELALAL